jgi:hypothetical protein
MKKGASMLHQYGTMSNPYIREYMEFLEAADNYKGYDFGQGPTVINSPTNVEFSRPLKWWSLDRPKRLKAIRRVRDEFLQDILKLGTTSLSARQMNEQVEAQIRSGVTRMKNGTRRQNPGRSVNYDEATHKEKQAA